MNDNFSNKYKMDKISYALGLSIGNNFQSSGIDKIVSEDFIQGLQDVLQQKEPALSYEEAKQVINRFFVEVQEKKYAFEQRSRKGISENKRIERRRYHIAQWRTI